MGARLVAATGDVAVGGRVPGASVPAAPWAHDRVEHRVDGLPLGRGRDRRDDVEVHRRSV